MKTHRMRFLVWLDIAVTAAAVSCGQASGAASAPGTTPATRPADGVIPSPEADWPQWRGPRRDGHCDERGLLADWPAGGPKLLWKIDGLGRGWSSPIIVAGRLFISGDAATDLHLQAYDLEGKPLWRVRNGAAWRGSYPGARACLLYSRGRLFHMNAHGRVACLDAASGKEHWSVNVLERFGGKSITWGLSECLLADGDRVIVTPGGSKAAVAALDQATGNTVWASKPIEGDDASYSSPILVRHAGRRHLIGYTSGHLFGADPDTGELQWRRQRPTRYQVISAMPLYRDGLIVAANPDGKEGECFRLVVGSSGVDVQKVWDSRLENLTGGVVWVEGRLYTSGYRRLPGWMCVDFRTGQLLYRKEDLASGSAVVADGRLYCLSEQGEMALLAPAADGLREHGRFRLVEKHRNDVWAHPVIHNGRLYLRYHDTLWCFDVRAK